MEVRALAASSNVGYRQVGGELRFHRLGGRPFGASVRGQYYEFPQEDFFGLGPQTQEQNRTSFLMESTEVGADVWWTPVERLRVGAGISYLDPSIGSGTDNRYPSAEERAAGDILEPHPFPPRRAAPSTTRDGTPVKACLGVRR